LLIEAPHLRMMNGQEAEIDLGELGSWVEPLDHAYQTANLLGMKVPRRGVCAGQTEGQPVTECQLRRAVKLQVVEAIVSPRVKHAVRKERRGKSNRSAQEQLDAVRDPEIAQGLEEVLVSYRRSKRPRLPNELTGRFQGLGREQPIQSFRVTVQAVAGNPAHGIQQVLAPRRAPCRRCGTAAQPRFHLLNVPVGPMLTLQLCLQVNRRS